MDLKKYESIRPLAPEEVQTAIQHLTSLEPLRAVYESLQLEQSWDELVEVLSTCHSVEDFKRTVSYHWVKHIMRKCCSSVELTGTEHITKDGAYTYISNHRDIILDSAFLNVLLADIDAKFPEIAIGDNLMLYPWIETLVKLNGSFLVRRNLQGREVLLAARLLSEYMHDAIAEGKSLWIAQREGRSKDSTDKTQPALLKMLALGAKSRQPLEALAPLNIIPVTCSYEYDPCDYLKAQEMQLKRDVEGFKKSPADDGINMRTGIFGWKGEVSFHIGRPLDELVASRGETAEQYSTPEAIALLMTRRSTATTSSTPSTTSPSIPSREVSVASMTIVLRTKLRLSSISRAASIWSSSLMDLLPTAPSSATAYSPCTLTPCEACFRYDRAV